MSNSLNMRGGGTIPNRILTSSALENYPPWYITAWAESYDSSGKPNQCKCSVNPGTINSILANNHFDGALLKEFSVTSNTLTYVILKVTTDGKGVTSCELSVGSTMAKKIGVEKFKLPTSFEVLIGVVYNDSVYQVCNTMLFANGRVAFAERTNDENKYDIYFTWDLSGSDSLAQVGGGFGGSF